MIVKINKEVFNKFNPKFKTIFILVTDADNKSKLQESKHLLKEITTFTNLTFNKETIKNHHLISPWVVAQEEFGKDAKHYHTSVEKLLKKVLDKKNIYSKDVLTNVINYLNLKYLIPSGVDDYDKIDGDVNFKIAKGNEKVDTFRTLKKGAIYYCDKKNILSTKLDYWNHSKTKLSSKSKNVLIHFDILPPVDKKKANQLLIDAKELIKVFCGGKIKSFTLSKRSSFKKI